MPLPAVRLFVLLQLLEETFKCPMNNKLITNLWSPINTAKLTDDLIWLYDGVDTIDGPRLLTADDYDKWLYWAECTSPATNLVDINSTSENTNSKLANTTDMPTEMVSAIVRAYWRRIHKFSSQEELPTPLPTKHECAMRTALMWLGKSYVPPNAINSNFEDELAEADRRAGAAERRLAVCNDKIMKNDAWLAKLKDDWGVDGNVSFDVIWAEALAFKREALAKNEK